MSAPNKEAVVMATKVGTPGNDTLVGVDSESNLIYGDTSGHLDEGTGGNDTLTGGANSPSNTIYGDADEILGGTTPGTGGNDTLIGGVNSNNLLVGDAATLRGGGANGGNDILIGGVGGVNFLIGDAGGALGNAGGGFDRLDQRCQHHGSHVGRFSRFGDFILRLPAGHGPYRD
jgi:hypothetical protein